MYQEPQNTYFAEELEKIVPITIPTSHGDIYAQTVGQKGQPLIIIVHGSGPKNSSDQYQYLLHEYLVRISYIQKFYIIAIDCPGYGRSTGSMIAIKTFPLEMFREILAHLGYKTYFAMFGHSQGGAAIFNSVYDDPSITEFLLMDRPVCGNIKRFSRFNIPTLLVYDIEDDGHPIWQGKQLYKELAKTEFHTYRNSQEPFFVPDNIWNIMLKFLSKYSIKRRSQQKSQYHSKSLQKVNQRKRSESSRHVCRRKVISLDKRRHKQKEQEQKDIDERLLQIKQIDRSELYSKISDFEQFEELPLSFNQPKIQQTQEQARLQQQVLNFQKNMKKVQKPLKQIQKVQEIKQGKVQIQKQKLEEVKKQQNKTQKSKLKTQNSKAEDKCPICYEVPYYPLETNCKHIYCSVCIRQSLLVDDRCPMCRAKVHRKQARPDLNLIYLNQLSSKEKQKRQIQLNKFQQLLKSIVYIEIGNNSRELPTKQSAFTKTKKKYMWEIFVKEPKNFKLEEVGFNINMGNRDAHPVKVTSKPFVFESRGTFSFSCEITIKPRNREYDTLIAVYRIDVTPGTHTKTIALKKKK